MFWVMMNVEGFWPNIRTIEHRNNLPSNPHFGQYFLDFKYAGVSPLMHKLFMNDTLEEEDEHEKFYTDGIPPKFTEKRQTLDDWIAEKEAKKDDEDWTDGYGGSIQEAQDMAREDNETMGDLGMWSDPGD